MKILAVMNEKGGVGKSTIALNLATNLHRAGHSVVLVDADPMGTLRDWRDASPADADLPPVIAIDRPKMLQNSLQTLSSYNLVVIDSPAKADAMAAAITRAAHIALIVVQPSGADLWASASTVKLIHAKRELGAPIKAAFLINRVHANAELSKQVQTGDWNSSEIAQLESTIGNRVAVAQAITDGLSVYDLKDGQAKAEFDLLILELEEMKWL